MPTGMAGLARRVAALRRAITSTFPDAHAFRLFPHLAEHHDATPFDLAAAEALRALDDLLDELTAPRSPTPPDGDASQAGNDDLEF